MLAGSGVYPYLPEAVLQRPAEHSSQAGIRAETLTPDTGTDPTPRSLDPRAVTLWRIQHAIRAAFLAAMAVGFGLIFLGSPLGIGLVTGVVVLVALTTLVLLPPLQYRLWRFGLHDEHLRLRHGVVFRTTSIVPYARIQHVDTRHGPLDRWIGLASLMVFTAGTRGAILTIPALAAPEAEELRDRLAALSGTGDAV